MQLIIHECIVGLLSTEYIWQLKKPTNCLHLCVKKRTNLTSDLK